MLRLKSIAIAALLTTALACSGDELADGEHDDLAGGKADEFAVGSAAEAAILALLNDPATTFEELDDDARLNRRAARNLIDDRGDGYTQVPVCPAFEDEDCNSVDDVSWVGPRALGRLLAYADEKGLLGSGPSAEVIFSPQPAGSSHVDRVAKLIEGAQHSVDIAMYSFSSSKISEALEDAVDRGVSVRFVFETARKDNALEPEELATSKSARLENIGVSVRFVNKIMHHKMAIIDGPRDDIARASTARVATGSANWSFGGASIYDENTVFITGQPELALELQREFNLMWNHSRDVVVDPDLPFELSSLDITDDIIADSPNVDVFFTSENFSISEGGTTFRTDKSSLAVADTWVRAINGADESIWIASGHLRLRPVAEALIAKRAANPEMDIRVLLDGQEYISFGGDQRQKTRVAECVEAATTSSKLFDCQNKSFLWGKSVGDGDIDVRYKYYAYRWDFSYAVQMHHKFMVIDSDTLYSGSYNLSINAEHGTFEQVVRYRGADFQQMIDRYEESFEELWELGRDEDLLAGLVDLIESTESGDSFPIVFEPMTLEWSEISSLKSTIKAACPAINDDEFRKNAAAHKTCAAN